MPLNPKGKYLIQDGSNHVYSWTEALSKRKDMRPYDPVTQEKKLPDPMDGFVPITLRDRTFQVHPDLKKMIDEMRGQLKELVEGGFEEKVRQMEIAFEAQKERLTTDILDLQEQLASKAQALDDALVNLAELAKTADPVDVPGEPSEEPKKRGPKPKGKEE